MVRWLSKNNNLFTTRNSRRKMIMLSTMMTVSLSVFIAVLMTTGTIKTSSSTNVNDIFAPRSSGYGVMVDWPLSPEFENHMQLITVNRGESVAIPVKVAGSTVPNDINMAVTLAAENIGKLNSEGKVEGEPPLVPPLGVTATFSQQVVNVRSGVTTNISLDVSASSHADTGTYLYEILGKVPGHNIGTAIYIRIA